MQQKGDLQVLVVGAGIGGLALAGCLRRAGFDPVLIDDIKRSDEIDHGTVLPVTGMAVLSELAVAETVLEIATPLDDWVARRVDGDFHRVAVDDNPLPCMSVHRKQVRRVLRTAFDDVPVRLGTTVERIENRRDAVEVTFRDGVREQFDLVVGADGVHSAVRSSIYSSEEETFCGTTSWAFWTTRDADAPRTATEVWGPTTARRTLPLGDRSLCSIVTMADKDEYDASVGSLRRTVDGHDNLLPSDLDVSTLGATYHADDYQVRASPWIDGNVVLLGDAAHAIHPFAGIGTALAIEDAYVLAYELDRGTERVSNALSRYVDRRRFRRRSLLAEPTLPSIYHAPELPLLTYLKRALSARSKLIAETANGLGRTTAADLLGGSDEDPPRRWSP